MGDEVRSLIRFDSCGLVRTVGQGQVTDNVGQRWISEEWGMSSGH
jgi:hypothetical protein